MMDGIVGMTRCVVVVEDVTISSCQRRRNPWSRAADLAVGGGRIRGNELRAFGVAADLLRKMVEPDGPENFVRLDVDLDLVGDVLRDDGLEGPFKDLGHQRRAVDDVDFTDLEKESFKRQEDVR